MTTVLTHPARDRVLPPELVAFDHLHWWVGNARHAAHFYASAFGFSIVGYAGPETGVRDRQSYVVAQGELRFVLSSPLDGDSQLARHVARHGDGVRDVAYAVRDVGTAFDRVIARGAEPVAGPHEMDGVTTATVAAYGDTVHTLIARRHPDGPFLPGYEAVELGGSSGPPVGLRDYDHVVANVEQGRLDDWVDWYGDVWGLRPLQHFSEDAISTEYSALRSTVVSDGHRVVQPLNEPAPGRKRSQIEEYLDYYGSPGVQHVAMATDDIVTAVAALQARGVRFLRVPPAYYRDAPRRVGDAGADLPWDRLAELGILVDADAAGLLLQVFTEAVASRPTAFLEIIERRGARGFGEGNFKALFTSIEAEQARRGNL